MPCRDDCGPAPIYERGHDPHFMREAKRLQKKCDELTDMLCSVGRARYRKTNIPPKVLNWWQNHCKWDAERGEPW